MGRIEGRVAVVTGAARGIGRAVAERFAAEGARVVAIDLREPTPPLRPPIQAEQLDISSDEAVKHLFARVAGELGSLDILANVAAVQVERNVVDTTLDQFDWMVATNLRGVFICCRHAIPHMRKGGRGAIVNIGSISGMFGDPGLAVYSATKGGVHALTRAITVDHGQEGIRCNAILPGWIKTELTAQFLAQARDPAAAERAASSEHPVGRVGLPEDIANVALFLASDESAFIAGQLIGVDGGMSARSSYHYEF